MPQIEAFQTAFKIGSTKCKEVQASRSYTDRNNNKSVVVNRSDSMEESPDTRHDYLFNLCAFADATDVTSKHFGLESGPTRWGKASETMCLKIVNLLGQTVKWKHGQNVSQPHESKISNTGINKFIISLQVHRNAQIGQQPDSI